MIVFTVPGFPVAQPRQRHRVVTAGGRAFARNYTPKDAPVAAFKAACRLAAQQAHQGPPLSGPLFVVMRFVFPRPKSLWLKRKLMARLPKTSKPDWDNIGKAVSDALNGVLWHDDAQLACVRVEKWIAAGDEQAFTEIEVTHG